MLKIKKIWNLELKIKIENQELFCKEIKFENKRMKKSIRNIELEMKSK